ncbi:MAG: hypothetical protein ABL903_16120 [Methylococcales bacterium]
MRIIALIFLLIGMHSASADPKKMQVGLDHVFILDKFRLFYSLEGDDALSDENKGDFNANHIPDFVESVAKQLKSAADFYTQVLALDHPLMTKRYKGNADFIDVHFLTIRHNGTAGDELISISYPRLNIKRNNVLVIKISNSLKQGNLTPAHELFHLFQNGYAMFKNRWYTEGTARWVEFAFKKGTGDVEPLPASSSELNALLKEDYQAKTFWNSLALLCDQNAGVFLLTNQDRQEKDFFPSPFQDTTLYGITFVKTFLQNLERLSLAASASRNFPPYHWPEQDQRNLADNNDYIFCAIRGAIQETCPTQQLHGTEMVAFLSLLKNMAYCQ